MTSSRPVLLVVLVLFVVDPAQLTPPPLELLRTRPVDEDASTGAIEAEEMAEEPNPELLLVPPPPPVLLE